MNKRRKAEVILEELDKKINVNWNMKSYYIDAILHGLTKIELIEDTDEKHTESICKKNLGENL